jgi:hypothetical protein
MSKARDIAEVGNSVAANTTSINTLSNSINSGRKNIVYNGDMRIYQRGSTQSGSTMYIADRWTFAESGTTACTSAITTDVPAGQGFSRSGKIEVTTASGTPSSSNYAILRQRFEGQDLQNLLYGTSDAKELTLSFWIKSSKTGIYNVQLTHVDATNKYNTIQYTINTANTWEKKTVTFSGDQTTPISNSILNKFEILFWFMAGPTYSGGTYIENTWQATNSNRAVNQVNAMDTIGNTIYITGIQFEIGSSATDFEQRSYQEELSLCRRYYYRITQITQNFGKTNDFFGIGQAVSTTKAIIHVSFPVPLRARAEALEQSGTAADYRYLLANGSNGFLTSVPAYDTCSLESATISIFGSGLVAGNAVHGAFDVGDYGYLGWSAEL